MSDLIMDEFHFSEVYRSVNYSGSHVQSDIMNRSCKLCNLPILVYTSVNIRKIKFNVYIYIHFNQNLDKNLI